MTLLVAVFRPNVFEQPTGLAWWDSLDGTVRSVFANSADQMLAMSELVGARNFLQFESKVARLAARTPASSAWDEAEISVAPDVYLNILRYAKAVA